ncbi:cupin domain-containing protein [Mesorhizobium sp. M9A.F.Ca.ET.002.03.1.2]|uniref:cupin domain-containing protein n=1 Tax=Mesorhizobium sp. M9A.F.Ca.ET.002.03.1.2 TaxID=2493668 RepID=UPI000F7599BA|nr:cupin domain-containing protein [Mesorhizobium sp. M9A.F.Ca.ET.002.03.1.2]AZO00030.1 cupin domain-containing protein [Mesorhizobium sp. M9A.F.Ca.ET.002.03.1.2]
MSRCGDVYENKVTGEYAVILRGTEDRGQGPGIVHLTARPGAAVVGEHFHPNMIERFTLVRGRLDARIAGKTFSLEPGQSATVEAGVAHDWWNSSNTDDAQILIEIERAPGADHIDPNRFELLIGMLFGLANAGKVDKKGRPSPLQAAVIAREFADVIVFTRPPPAIQWAALGILAPIANLLGYRAIDPSYCRPHAHFTPAPEILVLAGLPAS